MKVEAFRLTNFMSFMDTGWIYLDPLKVLYGRNSSGKSVIIRALSLLKQSLDAQDKSALFEYSKDENHLNVGSFQEIIHTGQSKIGFHFRCNVSFNIFSKLFNESPEIHEALDKIFTKSDHAVLDFTLEYMWNSSAKKAELLDFSIKHEYGDVVKTVFSMEMLGFEKESSNALSRIQVSDYLHAQDDTYDFVWPHVVIKFINGFIPQIEIPLTINDVMKKIPLPQKHQFEFVSLLLLSLHNSIVEFLGSINHIKPIRPEPKHLYVLSSSQQKEWEVQGLGWFVRLLRSNVIETLYQDRLESWLQKLGIGKHIKVVTHSPFAENTLVSEVQIQDLNSGNWVNIENLGFGTSQVLPILLAGLLSKQGDFIVIEQPELHLHPDAQASLADFLIEQTGRGTKFVIETHSEHLLLRIQRRIAETTLAREQMEKQKSSDNKYKLLPSDVGILFIKKDGSYSLTEDIRFNELGQPIAPSLSFQNFFVRDYEDVVEHEKIISAIMAEKHD